MNKKLLLILVSFSLAELNASENPQYRPHRLFSRTYRSSSRKRSKGKEVTSKPVRSTSVEEDLYGFGLDASSKKNKREKGRIVHTVPTDPTFDVNSLDTFSLNGPVNQNVTKQPSISHSDSGLVSTSPIPTYDDLASATVAKVLKSPIAAFHTIVDDLLEHTPEQGTRKLVDPFEQAVQEDRVNESRQTGSSSVPLSPAATAEQPRKRSSSLKDSIIRAQAFEQIMRGLPSTKNNG